ncbi:helix-turn-helix domain-containing protein [Listeria monocytogenes]|uniref:helix-turn-helix domain-containing protein n=1 Tax=Listeria monocytogenes TaxID=1639 RepID=UPI0010B9C509|nr:helix-turn-helix domain-containing protein [Listeria monocytogenes]EAW7073925.1 helix-turn-helix domain-containing protein [Listeria monocytogenes]EAW7125231.1 helix-turn-helix domain-containing protein [Listeria monocytogenes]ECC0538314.1 helix-turn-helix domain-containing protein [Listeria monocytogenes]EJN2659555.1 helix-turn-helix domain-containing protein [Listeria monocytogenes]
MAKGKYADWITDEGLIKLEGYARDGLIDDQVAAKIGIARQTLYEWKKKYPVIDDALKRGKEVVDRHVESCLLKNATGYTYTEDVPMRIKEKYYDEENRLCEKEKVIVIQVNKQKPAETVAQIFWLKNRKPESWRDKQNIEHSGNIEHAPNPFEQLSPDELRKIAGLET